MKSKVVKVLMDEFKKEDEAVQCAGERQPRGAAGGQGGRATSPTTAPGRPEGVVVVRFCAVRVPPKKVQFFIEKTKSFCGIKWTKSKAIGTFRFDKQPREDRIHTPEWTSRRSTLDLARGLRHPDYTSTRITVHLRGGRPAHLYTSTDWIANHVSADELVLRLDTKYLDIPDDVAVTAGKPQCQDTAAVDDHAGNIAAQEHSQTEALDGVAQESQHKDEGPDGNTEEAEEEKDEEGERWRNVVVVEGPYKGPVCEDVDGMGWSGEARPGAASSTGQVVDRFGEMALTYLRRAVAAIMALCLVAVLVDAWWDELDLA